MKRLGFIYLAVIATAAPAFAQAQQPACIQQENLICGPRGANVVARATGEVSIIRQAGATPAAQGSRLAAGDQVSVSQGAAIIALGPRCVVQLPANSSVRIIQQGDLTCIDSSALTPGGPPSATPIVGAFVGAFVAGLVAATGGGSDNPPVSP